MEALEPPATVEQLQPAIISRPGPVCGMGERVFQPATNGKYTSDPNTSSADVFFASSNLPFALTSCDEMSTISVADDDRCILERDAVDSPSAEPDPSSNNIEIYYQNVGGLNSSTDSYLLATTGCCYDVIALTETWLNNRTLSHQVFGSTFDVFRCDRNALNSRKTSGGGVLIAVRHGIKARVINDERWESSEQVWISVKLADRNLFLCVVYFPPDRIRDYSLIDVHLSSVSFITSIAAPSDDIVILGDFNLPGLTWCPASNGFLRLDIEKSVLINNASCILDNYSSATLRQINNIINENGRTLDLCFVSARDYAPYCCAAPTPLVQHVRHHPPLHLVLAGNLGVSFEDVSSSIVYDFKTLTTTASLARCWI
ncbi:uncharacterized protein LOC131693350 [Topomyia yanbarensis]|uniref:uncharacterized protein LOC131693350 n=1 Tax=Topomyia yanbarensis TaxID=2498891 RepID=UPI00273CBD36|nr:uncharacterized protein LOC131693350 [Topomyia yanbarensis]